MNLDTYEIGDTIDIPVTFTDLTTGVEAPSVPDAMIAIFNGNIQILAATPMIQISGGRYYYTYVIPLLANLGVYTVYITGTVSGQLQTASFSFSVSNRLTNLQTTANNLVLDIQANQTDIDGKFAILEADIGDPTVDGTTLHQELKDIKADLGDPLLSGQNITQMLQGVSIAVGLSTPVGTVVVTGMVTNDSGAPAVGVRVIAINTCTGLAADSTLTDATGTYTLNLNPGTYVLEFMQSTTMLQQTLSITVPTLVSTYMVPTIVQLATLRTVSDIVQDPTGAPLSGVLVKAILQANYNANAADNQVVAAAFTDANGMFTLMLFPGIYTILFVAQGYDTLPQQITVF